MRLPIKNIILLLLLLTSTLQLLSVSFKVPTGSFIPSVISSSVESFNHQHASRQWIKGNWTSLLDEDSPLAGLSQQTDLVLTFVDDNFLDVLSVWLHYFQLQRASFDKPAILCLVALNAQTFTLLEKALETFLKYRFGTVILTQLTNSTNKERKGIWERRVDLLGRFLNAWPHVNLLLTDLDAIWMQNPFPLINQHGEASLVASQGNHPVECPLGSTANQPVVTMCFGFVYFRNMASTRDLVDQMSQKFFKYGSDDQRALNCVLRHFYRPAEKPVATDQGGLNMKLSPQESTTTKTKTTEYLRVVILPLSAVTRYCENQPLLSNDAVILHCFYGRDKMGGFRSMGVLTSDVTLYDWGKENLETHSMQHRNRKVVGGRQTKWQRSSKSFG